MSPMTGLTRCAVHECPNKPDGNANLCSLHKQPGAIVEVNGSTMVITSWLVRHGNETGIVFLNDYHLGDLHGGAEGFRSQLEAQGFTDIQLLVTPEELDAVEQQVLASWSGRWLTEYPWEKRKRAGHCNLPPARVAVRRDGDSFWEYCERAADERVEFCQRRRRGGD